MRATSAVLLLAAASVAPAFAAPVSTSYNARRQTASADDSDALSLGTIGTIVSLGAPIIGGIIDHFKNNGQQRREAMELLARAEFDESGAIKLGDAASIASIGSSIVNVFHSIFGGSNDQQRRDELLALLARAELEESGALKLGDAANIASIGSSIVSVFHNIFGGNQRRDVTDESGALKLGDVANIAGIGSSVVSVLHNLFGGSDNQRRDELMGLLARAQTEVDESGAISFETLKNIGSIGGSVVSILHNVFGGSSSNQQQRSELEELFARQDVSNMSQSDAIKLGTIGTIFSVGAPIISGIIDHFKGNDNQQQRREWEELLARQDVSNMSQSDAIKLGTIGTIFSVGAPIISGIIDHFKGSDNQQQRREFEELLARFNIGSLDALD